MHGELSELVQHFVLLLGNQLYSGPFVSVKYVIGHHPLHTQMDSRKAGNPYLKHNTVMTFKSLKEIFRVYGFKIKRVIGSCYYPFPRLLGRVLCRLDKAHAHFLTLKVRKQYWPEVYRINYTYSYICSTS